MSLKSISDFLSTTQEDKGLLDAIEQRDLISVLSQKTFTTMLHDSNDKLMEFIGEEDILDKILDLIYKSSDEMSQEENTAAESACDIFLTTKLRILLTLTGSEALLDKLFSILSGPSTEENPFPPHPSPRTTKTFQRVITLITRRAVSDEPMSNLLKYLKSHDSVVSRWMLALSSRSLAESLGLILEHLNEPSGSLVTPIVELFLSPRINFAEKLWDIFQHPYCSPEAREQISNLISVLLARGSTPLHIEIVKTIGNYAEFTMCWECMKEMSEDIAQRTIRAGSGIVCSGLKFLFSRFAAKKESHDQEQTHSNSSDEYASIRDDSFSDQYSLDKEPEDDDDTEKSDVGSLPASDMKSVFDQIIGAIDYLGELITIPPSKDIPVLVVPDENDPAPESPSVYDNVPLAPETPVYLHSLAPPQPRERKLSAISIRAATYIADLVSLLGFTLQTIGEQMSKPGLQDFFMSQAEAKPTDPSLLLDAQGDIPPISPLHILIKIHGKGYLMKLFEMASLSRNNSIVQTAFLKSVTHYLLMRDALTQVSLVPFRDGKLFAAMLKILHEEFPRTGDITNDFIPFSQRDGFVSTMIVLLRTLILAAMGEPIIEHFETDIFPSPTGDPRTEPSLDALIGTKIPPDNSNPGRTVRTKSYSPSFQHSSRSEMPLYEFNRLADILTENPDFVALCRGYLDPEIAHGAYFNAQAVRRGVVKIKMSQTEMVTVIPDSTKKAPENLPDLNFSESDDDIDNTSEPEEESFGEDHDGDQNGDWNLGTELRAATSESWPTDDWTAPATTGAEAEDLNLDGGDWDDMRGAD